MFFSLYCLHKRKVLYDRFAGDKLNLELVRKHGEVGDIILTGDNSFLSRLIGYGQKTQTPDGKPSRWSHVFCLYSMKEGKETVFESTIDFKPYPAGFAEVKRLDNGVQLNYLTTYKNTKYAMLLHFPFTDLQRNLLKIKMDEMVDKGYTYPILGLFGSLLAYWLFRGWKSNPLQTKNSLYCSAAVQEIFSVIPIDFDPKHTARNSSPQAIANYAELHDEVAKYDMSLKNTLADLGLDD